MPRLFAGLLLGVYTPQLTSVLQPIALALLLVVTAVAIAARAYSLAGGILLGILLLVSDVSAARRDMLAERHAGDSLVAEFTIEDIPRTSDGNVSFTASSSAGIPIPPRVSLVWRRPPASLKAGDRWQLEVRLRPPVGTANPGGRDVLRHALSVGRGARGYVVASHRNRLLSSRAEAITSLRLRLRQTILESLPGRSGAPVLVALVTGLRHDFSAEQWRRYADSGTAHLVAISGLHIGLVAGFAMLLARPLTGLARLRLNQRLVSAWSGVLAAGFFVLLSGNGVPARRAWLMLLVVVLAMSWLRQASGIVLLSLAGCVVLVLQPTAALSTGFMLSFAAVFVLLWTSQMLANRPARSVPAVARVWSLMRFQFAIFFGLMPALALAGLQSPFTAPLLNVVAVPLFSLFTVPVTLLAVLAGGEILPGLLLSAAASSVEWLDMLIDRAGQLPGFSAGLTAGSAAFAWLLLPRGFPGRYLALLAPVLLVCPPASRVPDGCLESLFVDVGQGTAILVETRDHRLLYDTGPAYPGGSDAAQRILLPLFRATRRESLDLLVVSHADADHAGGVDSLRRAFPGVPVIAGEADTSRGESQCRIGQAWTWDGVHFEMLHPESESRGGNNASCVLRATVGTRSLLLTGDIETDAERALLMRGLGPATVATVPHHGSSTSSTHGFVRTVDAKLAVVSAARFNRWDLPLEHIVRRWEDYGARVLEVSNTGALRLRLCGGRDGIITQSFRASRARWWQP